MYLSVSNCSYLCCFSSVADIVMWSMKGSRYIVISNNAIDIYSSEVCLSVLMLFTKIATISFNRLNFHSSSLRSWIFIFYLTLHISSSTIQLSSIFHSVLFISRHWLVSFLLPDFTNYTFQCSNTICLNQLLLGHFLRPNWQIIWCISSDSVLQFGAKK